MIDIQKEMPSRLSEAQRYQKYARYTDVSPLKTTASEKQLMKSIANPSNRVRAGDFVLDGVYEQVHKANVVPSYNAFNDAHAQTYFRQPSVKNLLQHSTTGNILPCMTNSLKLSVRQKIPVTPNSQDFVKKEERFVIDSVKMESLRSPRNPIIPQYDAMDDAHAQNYFRKRSVRSLVRTTCGGGDKL